MKLAKRLNIFAAESRYRSCPLEETLRKYAHLVGPSGIAEMERAFRGPCGLLHLYIARLRTELGKKDDGADVLRSACVGKGLTDAQARLANIRLNHRPCFAC